MSEFIKVCPACYGTARITQAEIGMTSTGQDHESLVKAVCAIVIAELTDRAGFDSAWDACDAKTRRAIRSEILNSLRHVAKEAAIRAKSSAAAGAPVAWLSPAVLVEGRREWSLCIDGEPGPDGWEPLYRRAPSAADKWRPISEAPKDGTRVLLWWQGTTYIGHWLDNSKTQTPWSGWAREGLYAMPVPYESPTHWQPLLPGPEAQTK